MFQFSTKRAQLDEKTELLLRFFAQIGKLPNLDIEDRKKFVYDPLNYRELDDNQIRELFIRLTSKISDFNTNVFAINFDIDPVVFNKWFIGEIPSKDSRQAVIYYIVSGKQNSEVKFKSTIQNLTFFNYNAKIFIFADGDNILFSAIPLFTFARAWTDGSVNANIFYRKGTYPSFVKALQEIYGLETQVTPLNVVSSYGNRKDASDIALATTVIHTANRLSPEDEGRKLFIVTNDRISVEISLTAKDFIVTNGLGPHTVTILDPRTKPAVSIWNYRRNLDEAEFLLSNTFTEWFINFIRNYEFPIPREYEKITEIIKSASKGEEVYQQIEEQAHKIGFVGIYNLWQQYLVITGQKIITSSDLRIYLENQGLMNWTNPAFNEDLTYTRTLDDKEKDPRTVYRVYRVGSDTLDFLNTNIVPGPIFWIYKVYTWAEAIIQIYDVRVAFRVVYHKSYRNNLTELEFAYPSEELDLMNIDESSSSQVSESMELDEL